MNRVFLSLSLNSVDSVGASVSILCAIHCIAMPFLIALLPLSGIGLVAQGIGERIVFVSILLAAGSLCWGFRLHRKRRTILALAGGAGMILAGSFLVLDAYETAFNVTGAMCLASAHLMNRRLCNACRRCSGAVDNPKSLG